MMGVFQYFGMTCKSKSATQRNGETKAQRVLSCVHVNDGGDYVTTEIAQFNSRQRRVSLWDFASMRPCVKSLHRLSSYHNRLQVSRIPFFVSSFLRPSVLKTLKLLISV